MTTTLEQIVKLIGEDADIDIYYHDCKSKDEAIKKILPIKSISKEFEVGFDDFDGSKWAFAKTDNIKITAFYEDNQS